MSALSPERLLALVLDSKTSKVNRQAALAEMSRRLHQNKATHLTCRYCSADGENREDAFDGLVALCWKAKGKLYVLPDTVDLKNWDRNIEDQAVKSTTREFIQMFLTEWLNELSALDGQTFLLRALRGDLKHIGNRCRSRIIDEFRRRVSLIRRSGVEISFDFILPQEGALPPAKAKNWAEQAASSGENKTITYGEQFFLPTMGYASSIARKPSSLDGRQYVTLIEFHKKDLVEACGERGYEVLSLLVSAYSDHWTSSRQETKSASTRRIAEGLGVSLQQARQDKRDLTLSLQKAVRMGNKGAQALHTGLTDGSFDRHKVEWVTDSGQKCSVTFSMPLSFSKKGTDKVK